jgi:hypothetical protein
MSNSGMPVAASASMTIDVRPVPGSGASAMREKLFHLTNRSSRNACPLA